MSNLDQSSDTLSDNCHDGLNGLFTGVSSASDGRNDNLPERTPGHVCRPKTRRERWAWLVSDAQRILRDPLNHRGEEIRLACEILGVEG